MHKIRKALWLSAAICLLLWSIIKAYLLYSGRTYEPEAINEWFKPITSKYGIRIVYKIEDDFFSPLVNPPIPEDPGMEITVRPIRHSVLAAFPNLLSEALRKYPVSVIKQNLKAIYFAGEINQKSLRYGATYDPFRHIIYLISDGEHTDQYLIATFHHEFSSLLLRGRSFFINPWTKFNPEKFEYMFSKSKQSLEIYKSTSLIGTEADYENGFMNTYGQVSFENDFNEYSAMTFTNPKKFKAIMNQYPRVRGKFLVWLQFYQKVDPIFTEDYLFESK